MFLTTCFSHAAGRMRMPEAEAAAAGDDEVAAVAKAV
jgi:hypothetical protein